MWGGLVPENAHRPRALRGMVRAGALGFKAFMIDSGVDSFGRVVADDLRAALPGVWRCSASRDGPAADELHHPLARRARAQARATLLLASFRGVRVRTLASDAWLLTPLSFGTPLSWLRRS